MQYHIIAFKDVIVSILAGYMMIPMVLFINNVSMLFSKNYLEAASQTLLTYPFVVQIILMAVIPALVEEFIFRGLFYGTYRKCGILKGALMSGLVFGLFHLNINQFCYAFVIGVVFAFLVEATGSIWSSVLAHFAINTYSITIIQLLKITGTYDTMQEAAGETVVQSSSIPMLLTLAMLLGVSIGFMSLVYLCNINRHQLKYMSGFIGNIPHIQLLKLYKYCFNMFSFNNIKPILLTTPCVLC